MSIKSNGSPRRAANTSGPLCASITLMWSDRRVSCNARPSSRSSSTSKTRKGFVSVGLGWLMGGGDFLILQFGLEQIAHFSELCADLGEDIVVHAAEMHAEAQLIAPGETYTAVVDGVNVGPLTVRIDD